MSLNSYTQRSRLPLLIGLCFAAGAFLAVPCGGSARSPQEGNVIRFVRNPDSAPEFKLDDLDGKALSLAGARGNVVLLNFWATLFRPCRPENPHLIALQR